MSKREDIFQAFVAALKTTAYADKVRARRTVPNDDKDLPLVLVRPTQTPRRGVAYNNIDNRLTIVMIIAGSNIAEIESMAAVLLTAVSDKDAPLQELIEGLKLSGITEDRELVAQQIDHQRFEIEATYRTTNFAY